MGIEKLLEVHLEIEIVATRSLDECSAVLCGLFESGMEQRLQTLPELRSHVQLTIPGAAMHGPLSSRVLQCVSIHRVVARSLQRSDPRRNASQGPSLAWDQTQPGG